MQENTNIVISESGHSDSIPKSILDYLKIILTTVSVVFVLKSLVIEAYQIPTASMKDSLLEGDCVLVNKLAYGLRSPRYLPFTTLSVPAFSLDIFGSVQRNDVVIFEYPGERQLFGSSDPVYFVKRCIGLPGDKVEIRTGDVYVNGRRMERPVHALVSSDRASTRIVPFKGQRIDLHTSSDQEWKQVIEREGHRFSRNDQGSILIDGQIAREYTIEHDYYFVMGDNRENSLDSRSWGFVPDENIVGEALIVYWSSDPDLMLTTFGEKANGVRWERIGAIIR